MNATVRSRLSSAFQPVIGQSITIRPLDEEDFDIEAEFIRSLSVETRARRLLGVVQPGHPRGGNRVA